MKKLYTVVCKQCGEIEADTTDSGLYQKGPANRRAGYHEGLRGTEHRCEVIIEEKTDEYLCPVCHTKCVGEKERDDHAKKEPGVKPSSFTRV